MHLVSLIEIDKKDKASHFGGGAFLENGDLWPKNPAGLDLTHIISISSNDLNALSEAKIPEGYFLSVFSTFIKDEYFLDCITYSGDVSELEDIRKGFTKVMVHKPGNEEIKKGAFFKRSFIDYKNAESEKDGYQCSKIGGKPDFLQNEIDGIDKMTFVAQISPMDLGEDYKNIFYIKGAIGYVFLSEDIESHIQGLFFAQAT
jgi:hypothetical protein